MPKLISLIVCTLGRRDPLARLLASLRQQVYPAFEVVVIDQNEGDYLGSVLAEHHGAIDIRHVRSPRGLSRARNVGLRNARGAILGFPDDDCWYDTNVAAWVARAFAERRIDLLTGRTVDRAGNESVSRHRQASGLITRSNVFVSGNSNTLFVRQQVAIHVGGFDETLGVGASTPFQSGEETDFILRCIDKKFVAQYDSEFVVRHDQSEGASDSQVKRARTYSPGFGRLLRTHRYGVGYVGARVGRTMGRSLLCAITGDVAGARQRVAWAHGTLLGYLAPTAAREVQQQQETGVVRDDGGVRGA